MSPARNLSRAVSRTASKPAAAKLFLPSGVPARRQHRAGRDGFASLRSYFSRVLAAAAAKRFAASAGAGAAPPGSRGAASCGAGARDCNRSVGLGAQIGDQVDAVLLAREARRSSSWCREYRLRAISGTGTARHRSRCRPWSSSRWNRQSPDGWRAARSTTPTDWGRSCSDRPWTGRGTVRSAPRWSCRPRHRRQAAQCPNRAATSATGAAGAPPVDSAATPSTT